MMQVEEKGGNFIIQPASTEISAVNIQTEIHMVFSHDAQVQDERFKR